MKKILILALAVIFYAVPSFAQGGLIGVYLDTWGEICDIDDCDLGTTTILEVQIVHKLAPCATASQFMVVTSSGFTGTYLGEEVPDPFGGFGNSRYGIAIAYGDQYSSPIHILIIRYLIYGTSAPNSYIEVVADPDESRGIIMTDCNNPPLVHPALGGRAYVNGDGTFSCTTTPIQDASWGQIKALYRN
jgi:hypothetical protein